ncbi:MAG: pyridoxal phosphate-dependent aminotransferase [Promethearchaeota archaeon]
MPKIARGLGGIPQSAIRMVLFIGEWPGIVSLGIGEPDFDAPPEAVTAAIDALRKGASRYTADPGTMELREAILEKTKRDNNFEFDSEAEIMVTAGTSPALFGSVLATVEAGDEVIIPAPAYLAYEPVVKIAGGKPVFVPAYESQGFVPDADAIAEAVSSKTSLMIVCSPSNPTGAVWEKPSLQAAADLAVDHDFHILSDELYERIVYDGTKAHSIASFDGMADRTITINGVSKSHAMTGFRVGWVISSKSMIEAFRKIHQYGTICASNSSQAAAVAALWHGEHHVKMMVQEYGRRRNLLLKRINERIPLMSAINPKGSFFMFANINKLVEQHLDDMIAYFKSEKGKTFVGRLPPAVVEMIKEAQSGSKIAMLYLVAKANVLTTPGVAFGPVGENFLRISFAQEYGHIETAMDNIESALGRWG